MAIIPMLPTTTSADALHAAYQQRAAAAEPGSDQDWRRDHLGASLIGHSCDRFLWLSFRWALNPHHPGKLLRLFERGNREEAWIVEDLRAAGFNVSDRDPLTGEQWRVTFHGGHIGGGLDAIITGLLEAPKTPHVGEIKTHNRKSFARLKAEGVKKSKPQHWAQMQVYMRGKQLERAFYLAVCKDDDEIYTERVCLDREAADALLLRGAAIVDAPEPPPKLVETEFPPCVYTDAEGKRYPCQYYDLCHGDAVMPAKNCRTCVSSTPTANGTWGCGDCGNGAIVDRLTQRSGCSYHLTIPAIVNAQVVAVDEANKRITYQAADGRSITDGPQETPRP